MDEFELRGIICGYIKEICHYSQMQVFATSFYQKNYFQLQIDEAINGLINFFLENQSNQEEDRLYTTQQRSEQPKEQSGTQEEQGGLQEEQTQNENTRSFTAEELAYYDGAEGRPSYVAVNGIVYDVSMVTRWAGGTHFGVHAGQDVSDQFMGCHQGMFEILDNVPKIGVLKE